ncbi:ribonuclease P protein component [Candidatus Nitrotoga sp. M5]|uniref:ribonuclease P protein component n=1 Tax=Candidatus Nitrotoga sp. M5 TaxID=2890409 RepID=UPI00403DEDDF
MHALPFEAKQTFPPCRRIRQPTEFKLALRANCLTNKWFAVYIRKNENGYSRLGVIVSKRSMPKAVSRNFAKRVIRNVFRINFSITNSVDVVVRAKRQFNSETAAEGRIALLQLFQSVPK